VAFIRARMCQWAKCDEQRQFIMTSTRANIPFRTASLFDWVTYLRQAAGPGTMVYIFRRKKNEKLDENDKATRKSKYKIKGASFRTDAASVFEATLSTCRSGVAAMLDVELKRANSVSSITVDDSITSSIGLDVSESLCRHHENDECEDDLQDSASCLYTTPYHASFHPAPTQRDPTRRKQSQYKIDSNSLRQSVPNRKLGEFYTSASTRHSRRDKGLSSSRSCITMPSSVDLSRKNVQKGADDLINAYEKIVSDKGSTRDALLAATGWD
jgi:hypothetical protein